MFEFCIGCESLEELQAQETYWGLFGFRVKIEETEEGTLSAEDSQKLYGVNSRLVSKRLFHMGGADHGLVRLMHFSDVEAKPSVAAELKNLRVKGARWGAQLTSDVYNVLNHAEDVKAAGAPIHWKGPHRSTVYSSLKGDGTVTADECWRATSACVRECVVFQPMAVQNFYQRYEYTIPKYGKVDESSKYKCSQITHFGLIAQGGYETVAFYEETLGLLKTTEGEGKLYTFDSAEEGDRDILGLDQEGDCFYTTNVDCPESSTNVMDYVSGRLHILRYKEGMPSQIPDKLEISRPGCRGPCNYTLRVDDISRYHAKIGSAKGVTEMTPIMSNEFGEQSFSLLAPDGYFWTIHQTN
jgi:hypothetical protein